MPILSRRPWRQHNIVRLKLVHTGVASKSNWTKRLSRLFVDLRPKSITSVSQHRQVRNKSVTSCVCCVVLFPTVPGTFSDQPSRTILVTSSFWYKFLERVSRLLGFFEEVVLTRRRRRKWTKTRPDQFLIQKNNGGSIYFSTPEPSRRLINAIWAGEVLQGAPLRRRGHTRRLPEESGVTSPAWGGDVRRRPHKTPGQAVQQSTTTRRQATQVADDEWRAVTPSEHLIAT